MQVTNILTSCMLCQVEILQDARHMSFLFALYDSDHAETEVLLRFRVIPGSNLRRKTAVALCSAEEEIIAMDKLVIIGIAHCSTRFTMQPRIGDNLNASPRRTKRAVSLPSGGLNAAMSIERLRARLCGSAMQLHSLLQPDFFFLHRGQ